MVAANFSAPIPHMIVIRSVLYAIAFYLTTAVMLVGGIWLLLSPRSWAMAGLRLHGQICTWLLKIICGTRLDVRIIEVRREVGLQQGPGPIHVELGLEQPLVGPQQVKGVLGSDGDRIL